MKIRLKRIDQRDQKYTTLGYWFFTERDNKGVLVVEVSKMKDWRHELAVWGHELIEVAYCKLMGITTEECDKFDDAFEKRYESGEISPMVEGGDQKECPYYVGHRLGVAWEHFIIALTFAGWKRYVLACEAQMGIRA